MRNLFFLLLITSASLAGCELFGPDDDVAQSAVGLDLGTERHYRWTFTETDTAGTATLIKEGEFVVRVVGLDEELESLGNLIHIEIASTASDSALTDIWYEETDTALIEWAYRNSSATPLVNLKRGAEPSPRASPFLVPAMMARSMDPAVRQLAQEAMIDSVLIRDQGRIVYQFPLKEGDRWTSFTRPFLQVRTVIGLDTLTVEAGTFPCTIIKTEIPINLPFWTWYDCIGEEGLILREIHDPVNGNAAAGIPPYLLRERMELIARSP